VNVEREEIPDRKEYLDLKDREELLEQLVLKEKRALLDQREKRVSRDTMDYLDCLVCLDRRVCLELKEWAEKMAHKELEEMLDHVEIQELMEKREKLDHLARWDHVVWWVMKDLRVMVDLQAQLDHQDLLVILVALMQLSYRKSLATKTKDQARLMIPMEKFRETRFRVTRFCVGFPRSPTGSGTAKTHGALRRTPAALAPISPPLTPPSKTACTGSILTWVHLLTLSTSGVTWRRSRLASSPRRRRQRRRTGTAGKGNTNGSLRRSGVDSCSPSSRILFS